MNVRKSNGSLEEFSREKVKNGICGAFETAGEECDELILETIAKNLFLYDEISSAEIRRQVEDALMSFNKKVAKAYSQKYADRLPRQKKQDFIKAYIKASIVKKASLNHSRYNINIKNVTTIDYDEIGVFWTF